MKWFGNFYFYFCGNDYLERPCVMSQKLEEKPQYQRLVREHPELVSRLKEAIHERAIKLRMNTLEALEPVESDLDQAFNLMLSYGATEEELRM